MRLVANKLSISVSRVALAWLLTRPFVTSVILGAKTVEPLRDNLAATDAQMMDRSTLSTMSARSIPSIPDGWWSGSIVSRGRNRPRKKPEKLCDG